MKLALSLVLALAFPIEAGSAPSRIISATGSADGVGGEPGDAGPPSRIISATGQASGTGGPPQGPSSSATCPSPLTEKDLAAIAINPGLKTYFQSSWPAGCPGGP
jgi:hypothetical protein